MCPNEEDSNKLYEKNKTHSNTLETEIDKVENYLIKFKNGSSIEVITPQRREEEIIRGKRADIKHWMFDYECSSISNEELEELLKPL